MVENSNIDNFELQHDNFMHETIKRYQEEIKKYTFEIKKGHIETSNYAMLFHAYVALYNFTKDDEKYKCVEKNTVEKVCSQLLVKIKQEMDENINMADNFGYLAYIYEYKENLPKALEYLDKAVELDPSNLISRGSFKNHNLNDREGALEDFRKALEIEQDPEQREFIQKHLIDQIDLIRDTDKELRKMNITSILVTVAIIAYILFKIYVIFFVN